MPVLFQPPGGPLPILGGYVQTTQPAPSDNFGVRIATTKLIVSPTNRLIGVNLPIISSVGFYESDTGQVTILTFDDFGYGIPDGTVNGAILAYGQVRATHMAVVYNLANVDPWTGISLPGTGLPVLMAERVDQFAVYDPATVQTIVNQNVPLNTDPDGCFQGAGQVSVYAIDNYAGEVPGAAQPIGADPNVANYPSISNATPPPDFSSPNGVHESCHIVRVYGGTINTDSAGNYLFDDFGNAVITLDLSGQTWLDVQYIDACDVIDDDGQERTFTLLRNPQQADFPFPGT